MAHHFQKITDSDGIQLHITLRGATVSITDAEGNTIKFSAQLVPEVRATLLDVEKIHGGGLFSGQI